MHEYTYEEIMAVLRVRRFVKQKNGKYILMDRSTGERLSDLEFEIPLREKIGFLRADGKWGVYDLMEKRVLIECKYELIKYRCATINYWQVWQDGKVGVVSDEYVEIIAPQFDSIEIFEENLFLVRIGGLCGIYDCAGKKLIPVEYDQIIKCDQYFPGFLVQQDSKWGFISEYYGINEPCQWDEARQSYKVIEVMTNGVRSLYWAPKIAEAVDLGLSVKWADSDLPVFCSFGSTEYDKLPDSKWLPLDTDNPYMDDNAKLLKYNNYSACGVVDGLTELLPEDDAATHLLGPNWRTPTYEEIVELYESCNAEIVNGRVRMTGPNGNSILLYFPKGCSYQSSSIMPATNRSMDLGFNGCSLYITDPAFRNCLKAVRPVYDDVPKTRKPNPFDAMDLASVQIETTGYVDLGLSVLWSAMNYLAESPQDLGVKFNWHDAQISDHGECHTPDWKTASELIKSCVWIDYEFEGVSGYKGISPVGKAIFIPRNQLWTSDCISKDKSKDEIYWAYAMSCRGIPSIINPNDLAPVRLVKEK